MDIDKLILKFTRKDKRIRIANTTLKKKKMEDRQFRQLMVREQLDPHAQNWIQTQSLYTSQILTQNRSYT